jgi:2-aminoethylphosphonate-pyruvate transaminase
MESVRVMVDMSATLVHFGHVRLLKKAKTFLPDKKVEVVVGLTTDEEIISTKLYKPELSFEERKELLEAIKYVDEVVPTPWKITQDVLDQYNIDILVHGSDNSNDIKNIKVFPRTEGVSSEELRERALTAIVEKRNSLKPMFTPGPSNLSQDSILDIRPAFGRDDDEYLQIEAEVLENIRKLTAHDQIVRMQGSATTAIDVATSNFVLGDILIIDSGYYSNRITDIYQRKLNTLNNTNITTIKYEDIKNELSNERTFDWIATTYTETAEAFIADIHLLKELADKKSSKLFLDATASINLQDYHELSDACAFSSCKGLMGLTGAGFITFNNACLSNNLKGTLSWALDIETYSNKKTTGPYHAICSLNTISKDFDKIKNNIQKSKEYFLKKYADRIIRPKKDQPNLSTMMRADEISFTKGIPYSPRTAEKGTVVICHLGDAFTQKDCIGNIYDDIDVK